MLRMVDLSIEYCQSRKAFGKKIIDNQVIHYRMAELMTEIEALRSILYRIVGMYNFFPLKLFSEILKLY